MTIAWCEVSVECALRNNTILKAPRLHKQNTRFRLWLLAKSSA